MYTKQTGGSRRRAATPFVSQGVSNILKAVEDKTNDCKLSQSIYFGPTALTHIKRLIESGGTIITDTTLIANDIDPALLGDNGATVRCFIDDETVIQLAEQRHVTRAEVAVDYGLSLEGLKLLVIGSAPAAISRLLNRRQREPLSDVCVLAAPTGFASVVQLKERLIESDLSTIVMRGKKGGVQTTVALLNAILEEIADSANT